MPTGSTRATHVPPGAPDPIALEPGHEIGRFTVLSYLGSGAMGIVYAAYDPELDRKVALKVLRPHGRPDSHGRVRLHDEAQAMAKVSHPNVAVVHEVGLHDDGVFIAMEFIRGATLHAWLTREPRSWTETLDAFIQAGRGLAAAHAAGLVHRDFKPSNAMIGDDGRVRVLDFGLSCTPAKAGREVVGTPAYMPPEQFLGQPVGPASDQFSFCASLYQALFGQLPFPGDSAEELRLTVTGGQVRSPPRHVRVPSWLSAAILRGLRQDPKDRFSSMEDLLRKLDHNRSRGRRTLLAAVAGAAFLGLGGGYLGARAPAVDPCSGDAAPVRRVWTPESQAAIERAFDGLPPAFADRLWPRVRGALDRWVDAWEEGSREACEARQRRQFTEELATRSAVCFERARAALASAVVVLRKADATVALHALEVANSLPDPRECGSSASLVAHLGASRDVATAVERERIMAELERVNVRARAGRTPAAIELADAVIEEAHRLGDRPTLAHALLQRARLELERDPGRAEPYITRAYLVAVGAGEDNRVAEALSLRLYARARLPGGLPRAFEDLEIAKALLPRLGDPPNLRSLMANNAGALYLAAGDAARSETYLRQALMLRRADHHEDDLDVGKTLGNLALLSAEPAQSQRLIGEALEIFDTNLGPAHPEALGVRILAGAIARDPADAMVLLERGCDALEQYRPDDLRERAGCLQHLAAHARDAGEREVAEAAILQARALIEPLPDEPDSPHRFDNALIRGYAGLVDGTHAEALGHLTATLAELGGEEWWQRRKRAEIELCTGLHRLATGDIPGARRALEDSVALFARIADKAHDNVLPRNLAASRRALAAALLADRDPERAAQVLAAIESSHPAGDGAAGPPAIAALGESLE